MLSIQCENAKYMGEKKPKESLDKISSLIPVMCMHAMLSPNIPAAWMKAKERGCVEIHSAF